MGYPLVPGYESVGRVVEAGPHSGLSVGQGVYVPGARLLRARSAASFGGAAARLVSPGARAHAAPRRPSSIGGRPRPGHASRAPPPPPWHAVEIGRRDAGPDRRPRRARPADRAHRGPEGRRPDGVGDEPRPRRKAAQGYRVVESAADPRRDYRAIVDVSGDGGLLDTLISRLAPRGEVVLAGFYSEPLSFSFPPAFMREAQHSASRAESAACGPPGKNPPGGKNGSAVASGALSLERPDPPTARTGLGMRRGPPHRPRGRLVPEDDPGLEAPS